MKRLYIVRHGKSSWDAHGIKDIDRALLERGVNDAYKMAEYIAKDWDKPQLILSSPAIRALHSAVIFHRVLELPPGALKLEPGLYHADSQETLEIIHGVEDSIERLMIFGHNPGFTELANDLSQLNIMNVPTTGIVILDFDTDTWTETGRARLRKEHFDFPRNI